jgi:uncharacterized cupin superfamily protein
VPEAKLAETEHGLVPEGEGWFAANAREVPWVAVEGLGRACFFEGPDARFPELGFNVNVLPPGDLGSMYHAEGTQEGFLVLAGEGLVVVEGEERPLRAWDYFHCPADVPHVLAATGSEPLVYVAIGRRKEGNTLVYPVDATAAKHGASVEAETTSPKEAYAGREPTRERYRVGSLPDL